LRAGEWSAAGRHQWAGIRVTHAGHMRLATLIRVMVIRRMDIRVLQLVSMDGGRDTTADIMAGIAAGIMADIAVGITADTDTIASRGGALRGQNALSVEDSQGILSAWNKNGAVTV
jgi:hypothetical protein